MYQFNPTYHRRRSIRLKEYDYSQAGLYFITICIQDKIPLFGEIKNKEMLLSEIGHIAHKEWLKTEEIRDNVILHEFIVMPDHFHAILEIKFSKGNNHENIGKFRSPSQTIGSIIRGYKIATTKRIKDLIFSRGGWGYLQFAPTAPTIFAKTNIAPTISKLKIWQRDYYEHIIRDNHAYQRISNYIINNPAKWEKK